MKMDSKCIKEDPRYINALVAFINEWNSLRPIEQKKLLLKPLQLPLSVELCCLDESLNHDSGVCLLEFCLLLSIFLRSNINFLIVN